MLMTSYDLIIIGGGSGGLAAAIEAKKQGIDNILLIEKENDLGGILLQCIHNGFGIREFKELLSGTEYAQRFKDEFLSLKIDYMLDTMVLGIDENKQVICSNNKDGYQVIKGKAIIMATGCYERTRGAISIPGTRPSGVMSAGLAQRYINIDGFLVGKRVFILGSGDIGLIMARRMTLEGAKVLGVAELMPYSSGLNRNIVQCLEDFNIPLYLSHTISKIEGQDRIERITLSQVDENLQFIKGTEKEFEVDTLLLSVGLVPSNVLLENIGTKISEVTKGPVVNEYMETSVEGIFSCGNSLHVHDLVDFVSKEARIAAKGAAKYIKNEFKRNKKQITCVAGNKVSYVLPHMINKDNIDDSVEIKFRVREPLTNKKILIKLNEEVLKEIKKPNLAPAEMQTIMVKAEEFTSDFGELSVEIIDG